MKRQVDDSISNSQIKYQKGFDTNPNNVFIKNIQLLEKERVDVDKHLKEITKKLQTMNEACRIANIAEDGVNPFKKIIQSLEKEKSLNEDQLGNLEKKLMTLREALQIVAEVEETGEDVRTSPRDDNNEREEQWSRSQQLIESDEDTEIEEMEEEMERNVNRNSHRQQGNALSVANHNAGILQGNKQPHVTANASQPQQQNMAAVLKENSQQHSKEINGAQNCYIVIKEEINDNDEEELIVHPTQAVSKTPGCSTNHGNDGIFPFTHVGKDEFHASAQYFYQITQKQVENVDLSAFLNDMREYSVSLWKQFTAQNNNVMFKVQFWRNRVVKDGCGGEYQALSVSSNNEKVAAGSSQEILEQMYDRMSQEILKNYVNYCFVHPGGQFISVLGLDMSIKPQDDSPCTTVLSKSPSGVKPPQLPKPRDIKLPKWIEYKRAVVNIRKWDYQSFKWAILVALHHETVKKNLQRIELYKQYESELNFNNISFPVNTQGQVNQFEDQNPGLMIHILEVDDVEKRIQIQWISKYQYDRNRKPIVLLLYNLENIWHFGWVKNYGRLMNYQRCGTKKEGFPCLYCLKYHTKSATNCLESTC